MLFTNSDGRVLLVEPTYKEVFEAPGGAVESGESPQAAAAREVMEELGITIAPGRLVVVDYVPPTSDRRTDGVIFVFNGGVLTEDHVASISLASDELRSWGWYTVADVYELMRPLVARRIEVSLAAIKTGETVYLENGFPASAVPPGKSARSRGLLPDKPDLTTWANTSQ